MSDLSQKLSELNHTADTTAEFAPEDIQQNKGMAVLAYISWLVLIPLFGARESKFARFHCNQGLLLAVVEILVVVVCGIFDGLFLIGWVFKLIRTIVEVICFVLTVLGIINAANGRAKELPLIGAIRILK